MSNLTERLKACLESEGKADRELLVETLEEINDLREKRDQMEEILILLVRTGFPWDEAGQPDERFEAFRSRYENAMHEAAHLLGLDLRSMITRTEPRT
ncbi:hypothetical protein [Geomesophilobacter sediminis]|uniref:Uncharacterized protein n=1 Tax=Geomesophilobacter sediminis TaxID=2798584 RepID=A0A8J7JMS9_9BACT|nr:hypothetical protein [Geomesophilobacter sediminis]MBJ6726270.1 hypothetical protein [Geomesophilobacter sediminis]